LYTAASGALVAQSQIDNVSNNLANVNASGFKQTLLQVQSAPTMDVYRIQTDPGRSAKNATPGVSVSQPVGTLGSGAEVYDTPVDFSQGALQTTGNRLDFALNGANQFFTIQTQNGIRYTRDGQFTVNSNGNLTTTDGNLVLGTGNTPIVVQPSLGAITVAPDGTLSQGAATGQSSAGNQTIGQLQITSFGNLVALRPEGDTNFADTGNAQPAATQATSVQQGVLEQGNGNVVRSMVDLITAERWFQANSTMMKAQDELSNQAISNVAKASS
jgi:flagellar basal-body rod protein FlgG